MNPKIILFLDLDGVLTSIPWMITRHQLRRYGLLNYPGIECSHIVDPGCLAHLNFLLRATGAQIVISSTWRTYLSLEELRRTLETQGMVPGRIIGKTPRIHVSRSRGLEVKQWISENSFEGRFVVIDDDDDITEHGLGSHFVKTHIMLGLQYKEIQQSLKILGV